MASLFSMCNQIGKLYTPLEKFQKFSSFLKYNFQFHIPTFSINILHSQGEHFFFFFFNLILFFFYTAGSYQSSILYTSVYTCESQSPNSSHHHSHPATAFPPCCPYICSLHQCLYFCPENRFICTIFLGSTYMR